MVLADMLEVHRFTLLLPRPVAGVGARPFRLEVFRAKSLLRFVLTPVADALRSFSVALGLRQPCAMKPTPRTHFRRAIQDQMVVAAQPAKLDEEVDLFGGVLDLLLQFFNQTRSRQKFCVLAARATQTLFQQTNRDEFVQLGVGISLPAGAHPLSLGRMLLPGRQALDS